MLFTARDQSVSSQVPGQRGGSQGLWLLVKQQVQALVLPSCATVIRNVRPEATQNSLELLKWVFVVTLRDLECSVQYVIHISHYKFKLCQLCTLGQGATFLCLAQDSAMLTL